MTTAEIQDPLSREKEELHDQGKRTSFSIVLNIAKGAGNLKQAEKLRYFSIARGTFMECGTLLDLFDAAYTDWCHAF